MQTKALLRAIKIVGGQSHLARELQALTGKPLRQGNVWSWLNRTGHVPAEFAIPIERLVKGRVTRFELRPDIYPREEVA